MATPKLKEMLPVRKVARYHLERDRVALRSYRPNGLRVGLGSDIVTGCLAALTTLLIGIDPLSAQDPSTPASSQCRAAGTKFSNPPEIKSANGLLQGEIFLGQEQQALPSSVAGGDVSCDVQLVRTFRKTAPEEPLDRNKVDHPMPGPTLRASVGDIVQLTFVNQVDSSFFGRDFDIEDCVRSSKYPLPFKDEYPNCLHGSSTANIHFHGTHTNPNSTGDNVYLQVRPLPRDNRGILDPRTKADATKGFEDFFKACAEHLRRNPLSSWPATWSDLPDAITDKQAELLLAHQLKDTGTDPPQPLWSENYKVIKEGGWPIYYIGAFPYCFALPAHAANHAPGAASPVMGQVPGTHWYHAHKHGSTAINVANGMAGAFIIEGDYDRDLNAAYGSYTLKDGPWNASTQKVLVLNQLGVAVNALSGARDTAQNPGGPDFSVNGMLRPTLEMQPGEIQLWRIVNASGRTAIYFMPPEGLEWQQIAQDGVQYAPRKYENGANVNRPFYMAPANRVDLLVRAPKVIGQRAKVLVQNVMARSDVRPNPDNAEPPPEIMLIDVSVIEPAVTKDGRPVEQMPFLAEDANSPKPPAMPDFLKDIDDKELARNNWITRTFVFDSKRPRTARQHTINDIQFGEQHDTINILLGATEEWIVKNRTTQSSSGPSNSAIDHPLHIHINPFQVTEVFDPKEVLTDASGKIVLQDGQPLARYFLTGERLHPLQCELDPHDEATWREGGKISPTVANDHPCRKRREANPVWWDVFAIPGGRLLDDGRVIPGYYKMRSRFVDYPGLYVMHCHILIHEDRGMMFRVEVLKGKPVPAGVRHH